MFDANGQLAAQASIPPDIAIQKIGADYLLAVTLNELDVAFIEHLPLVERE